MKLLVLSNGHGEDVIACKIIEQLQKETKNLSIACLPLVGEGYAYQKFNIPTIAPVKSMPSGGFIYMETQQLWQDVRSGLINLTLTQYQAIKEWTKTEGVVLAVGDILPLLFAWTSGVNYAFVATAKSEYWLKDEKGWLPQTSILERFWGSSYYPWERWLMSNHRCKAVFPRDTITAENLQKYHIPAFDLGNPMMDDLEQKTDAFSLKKLEKTNSLTVLLLPGSRFPEAIRNWEIILKATEKTMELLPYKITFIAAIAPSLELNLFAKKTSEKHWQTTEKKSLIPTINDQNLRVFRKKKHQLILSQKAFSDCLKESDLAIAMAGTATEQFIGLGKPAIAIAGEGPQFTIEFAKKQARLLGISLILVEKPEEAAFQIEKLLMNPEVWQLIVDNGKIRMGSPGSSNRIAMLLKNTLICY